jgi:hypothetical protein
LHTPALKDLFRAKLFSWEGKVEWYVCLHGNDSFDARFLQGVTQHYSKWESFILNEAELMFDELSVSASGTVM